MTNKHIPPPWYANDHAVYMGADGGFSLRCCPNPEANARHIVHCVNYHHRLREALREASAQVVELCQTYDNPLPAASMRRYDTILAELDNLENGS